MMAEWYLEIQLRELSLAEIQAMVASILKTTAIPERLLDFIEEILVRGVKAGNYIIFN